MVRLNQGVDISLGHDCLLRPLRWRISAVPCSLRRPFSITGDGFVEVRNADTKYPPESLAGRVRRRTAAARLGRPAARPWSNAGSLRQPRRRRPGPIRRASPHLGADRAGDAGALRRPAGAGLAAGFGPQEGPRSARLGRRARLGGPAVVGGTRRPTPGSTTTSGYARRTASVLATVTGARRGWLHQRGEPVPPTASLRAMLPVNVGAREELGKRRGPGPLEGDGGDGSVPAPGVRGPRRLPRFVPLSRPDACEGDVVSCQACPSGWRPRRSGQAGTAPQLSHHQR